MTELVVAALGAYPGRVLLIEPTLPDVSAVFSRGTEVIMTFRARRRAKAASASFSRAAPSAVALSSYGDAEAQPFARGAFDSVVSFEGLPPNGSIAALRRLVRPGGTLVLSSSVRDGVAGGAASLVRRAARKGTLPLASDLTAAMLMAGVRAVRQAAVKRSLIPMVVTWGEVRPRPWEDDEPPTVDRP